MLQVFGEATEASTESVAGLEEDLRQALKTQKLYLEYQPIVLLDDGRITGLEAFLRWKHPERGPISPDQLLPVAEAAGLLSEIGFWVLNRACRQMKEWAEHDSGRFPPTIAVNISEKQLFDEEFVSRTISTVEASGLSFGLLRLDIGENALKKDGRRAAEILEALTSRGIRVAIDDFGTAHSSASHLHRFPIVALKIDKSFVSGKLGKNSEWDVACMIVRLAKTLDLEVIAEGVETREQFLRLRELGCQQAQGFYFSGPVAPQTARQMIREGYPLDLSAPAK